MKYFTPTTQTLITQMSFFNVDKLSAVSLFRLFTLSFNCIALVINLFLVHQFKQVQHVLLLESRQRGYDDISYRSNFKNKLEKKNYRSVDFCRKSGL